MSFFQECDDTFVKLKTNLWKSFVSKIKRNNEIFQLNEDFFEFLKQKQYF